MAPDPIAILIDVVQRLEGLGLRYVVGGSVASSIYGDPRPSKDVDLLVELPMERAGDLVAALRRDFYISEDAVREAIRLRRSFNAIDLRSSFKVDFFIPKGTPLDQGQLARKRTHMLGDPPHPVEVSSPEDTVLHKLNWYRLGGGVSDMQWRDVIAILKQQKSRLDLAYLREIAGNAGVLDLLLRAAHESGLRLTE